MKTISVVIPCYNEENSVVQMYDRLLSMFQGKLSAYDYEIIYADDYSKDRTREIIEELCKNDQKVKAIFNAKNFGFTRNCMASLKEASGDGVFFLFGDLQDPPEMLLQFVEKWEEGYRVIVGQKTKSKESRFMYAVRTMYYKLIEKLSTFKQIPHFNGFGFYDKAFIEVIQQLEDPEPYFRGMVSEFGMKPYVIEYEQDVGLRGSSGENFLKNYDIAMTGITSYTKILMRAATFVSVFIGIICIIISIDVFINKLLNWDAYPIGMAAMLVGVFFIGAVILFFIGILGEYVLSINTRIMKRPLVVIEKRINFEPESNRNIIN